MLQATSNSNSVQAAETNNNQSAPNTLDAKTTTVTPAWVNAFSKPDNRTQPWRVHDGISEDASFAEGKDLVRMADAEYPGGSLAA
jgi:hypothetical protein